MQWKLSEDRSKYVGREGKVVQNVLQTLTTDAAGAFRATFAGPKGFGSGSNGFGTGKPMGFGSAYSLILDSILTAPRAKQ